MDFSSVCTLCDEPLDNGTDKIIVVRQKGLATFIAKSEQRNDDKWKNWTGKSNVTFHDSCRKRYAAASSKTSTKPPVSSYKSQPSASALSSSTYQLFNFRELCFFCSQKFDSKHRKVCCVTAKYVQHRLIDVAERRGDSIGIHVMRKLENVSLVDVNARYHKDCYSRFIMVPKDNSEPVHNSKTDELLSALFEYIENSENFQFTLSHLQNIIGVNVVDNKTLCRKLKQKFGDDIYIQQHRGRETEIYYKFFNVSKICSDWFCDENSLGTVEKKTILTAAAQILRHEISNHSNDTEFYPPPGKFLDSVLSDIPPLLTYFLGDLLLTDSKENNFVKRDVISHSLVSALRPKSFTSTLQLAVGTYVYRKTGSKLIVDLLSKLGVSSSYYNIQLYEASSIIDPPKVNIDNAFIQFVFDNTDHNVRTLDGHETFHCLGGIAVYTPESEVSLEGGSKRCTKMPSASKLASQKQIPIVPYGTFNKSGLEKLKFVSTSELLIGNPLQLAPSYAAYLWAKCNSEVPQFPSWKGFMEVLSDDTTYFVSNITCLPFIKQPPSQSTTLNTALHYAATETSKLNQNTCFVTFDQPLYIKARDIVSQLGDEDLKNVVVRLGGFHLLMSYLGAIGHIMSGSGLDDLWSVVYAPQSVTKMLNGHAFARSLRAHILTLTALGDIICNNIGRAEDHKEFTREFLNDWNSNPPVMGDCNIEPIIEMRNDFEAEMHILESNGPTAKLWILYFRSVLIALQFIEAERLGDWKLHLQSVENMLPLFHASGHFAYAKSGQVYLQDMANLEEVMDHNEYVNFTKNGYFTIHKSDKAWSGVWSDMVIEQTLNRFFGTELKHGRGVTASVVNRFLLAMPSVFNVMDCLENYCDFKSVSSEQHVDLSASRIRRDERDIKHFIFWLNKRAPFQIRSNLMSLSTGIVGENDIDCHMAFEKGRKGMESMIGQNAANISLSTVYKVKNLAAAKRGIHVHNDDFVSVDSYLLFQRISVLLNGNEELTRKAFGYELSPFPLSLFDEHGLMRTTPKSELYKIFKTFILSESLLKTCVFVIDGGWLLHRVIWPHGKTYGEIFNVYLMYIFKHFGQSATIVFDGYDNEHVGTKSYERYRRREKNVAADVEISPEILVTVKQNKFLSNVANKMKFVQLLAAFLENSGLCVKIAIEDADALIVRTAINVKQLNSNPVAVVGNDVDLFILLIALCPDFCELFFYKIASGKNENQLYTTSYHAHWKPFILFAHAFMGCDTTSAIYRKGKKSIIKMLEKNQNLQNLVTTFYNSQSTVSDVCAAGEKIIMYLYNAQDQKEISISKLRYKMFVSSVSQIKKQLSLAVLPPTAPALNEHGKRVYYQIQQWLGNSLNPEKWGWKRTLTMMLPVMSTADPAPKELLKQVTTLFITTVARSLSEIFHFGKLWATVDPT